MCFPPKPHDAQERTGTLERALERDTQGAANMTVRGRAGASTVCASLGGCGQAGGWVAYVCVWVAWEGVGPWDEMAVIVAKVTNGNRVGIVVVVGSAQASVTVLVAGAAPTVVAEAYGRCSATTTTQRPPNHPRRPPFAPPHHRRHLNSIHAIIQPAAPPPLLV